MNQIFYFLGSRVIEKVVTGAQEQMHLINAVEMTDIRVRDCLFTNTYGDGIRVFGNVTETRYVGIYRNRFLGCKRAGIVIQRYNSNLQIIGNIVDGNDLNGVTISTDSTIDYEPTGSNSGADHIIANNTFHHRNTTFGATFGGIGTTDSLTNLIVQGNHFIDCPIRFFKTTGAVVTGNTMRQTRSDIVSSPALDIRSTQDRFLLANNTIEQNSDVA